MYTPLVTVGGSPMVEGVKSAVITGVGVAIYLDGQLKFESYI